MPEPIALDEIPASEEEVLDDDGKVACPECTLRFNPRGLKRHITMTHRGGISDSASGTKPSSSRKSKVDIAVRWKEFQTGSALLVSLACNQCATALVEDAEKDGLAIARFCENKAKLRKQLEDFLSASDFLLLVGALGGTAQKMISHHSIGEKLGMGITGISNHVDNNGQSPHERMASFMASMPPDVRHRLIDEALNANQRQAQNQQPEPVHFSAGAGGEPNPLMDDLAQADKELIAVVNSGSDFQSATGI